MNKINALLYLLILTQQVIGSDYATNRELFENKKILILGGTGYLGRSITQELLQYNPKQIVIFSRDEVKHFNMTKLFGNNPIIKMVVGDIRDYESLSYACKSMDIVFHTAALKRIDLIESNVEEAVKTNVIASLNVFNACYKNKVDKVIFISTDKACSPINAYGACKFVSEKIFTNYDTDKIKTTFLVARYGNILESTGSVVPIFTEKIKKGEIIPLTDPQMTRFILDKKEAIELIFDALRYGQPGDIFTKKLSALNVVDLIEVIKKALKADNEVRVTGIRPGEKIHEVLINKSEMLRTVPFKNYLVIKPSIIDPSDLAAMKGASTKQRAPKKYSSNQTVLSQDELAALFDSLGILKS